MSVSLYPYNLEILLGACTLIFPLFSNSNSVTFFLLKIQLVPTSDMSGIRLSLPDMKIDICGRSVKQSHIAGNVRFGNKNMLYLVVGHVVTGMPSLTWIATSSTM